MQDEMKKEDIVKRIQIIVDQIISGDYSDKKAGEYIFPDGTKYMIQEYSTKNANEGKIESHRFHIDIQYILSGKEQFIIYDNSCLIDAEEYDEASDVEIWNEGKEASRSLLIPNSFIVVYNGQPHKGSISFERVEKVKKIVCKLQISEFNQIDF